MNGLRIFRSEVRRKIRQLRFCHNNNVHGKPTQVVRVLRRLVAAGLIGGIIGAATLDARGYIWRDGNPDTCEKAVNMAGKIVCDISTFPLIILFWIACEGISGCVEAIKHILLLPVWGPLYIYGKMNQKQSQQKDNE
jgi:hypothetical protein